MIGRMAEDSHAHQEISKAALLDMPALSRLLADAEMREQYVQAVTLLEAIGFDAIMREIADHVLDSEPASFNEGAVLVRALANEQRTGFHKCRRVVKKFLDLQSISEAAPAPPDYGADDVLRRAGYDPDKTPDTD